ncbi:MAG: hypothetical protein JO107_02830 [Hyphomicrobiales bacterium]|nr:hypothetical protein [Hyphomicrobiales bacterium]MBV8662016.1 hypothetical protein [Hyphomicrobiales bacterium]
MSEAEWIGLARDARERAIEWTRRARAYPQDAERYGEWAHHSFADARFYLSRARLARSHSTNQGGTYERAAL